jgi:hypothetical protein
VRIYKLGTTNTTAEITKPTTELLGNTTKLTARENHRSFHAFLPIVMALALPFLAETRQFSPAFV